MLKRFKTGGKGKMKNKKLKTLKELAEQSWVEDYQIVPKEQTHPATQIKVVNYEDLKAEAVKWYKWHDKKAYRNNLSIMDWIKHFFNLTEDDLKQEEKEE